MRKMRGLLPVVGLLAVLLSACASSPAAVSSPASPSEVQSAWTACTKAIEQQKGEPATGAPRFNPASVTKLDAGEYIAVLYYSGDGNYYRCGLQKASDGTWTIGSLDSLQAAELTVWGLKK